MRTNHLERKLACQPDLCEPPWPIHNSNVISVPQRFSGLWTYLVFAGWDWFGGKRYRCENLIYKPPDVLRSKALGTNLNQRRRTDLVNLSENQDWGRKLRNCLPFCRAFEAPLSRFGARWTCKRQMKLPEGIKSSAKGQALFRFTASDPILSCESFNLRCYHHISSYLLPLCWNHSPLLASADKPDFPWARMKFRGADSLFLSQCSQLSLNFETTNENPG